MFQLWRSDITNVFCRAFCAAAAVHTRKMQNRTRKDRAQWHWRTGIKLKQNRIRNNNGSGSANIAGEKRSSANAKYAPMHSHSLICVRITHIATCFPTLNFSVFCSGIFISILCSHSLFVSVCVSAGARVHGGNEMREPRWENG